MDKIIYDETIFYEYTWDDEYEYLKEKCNSIKGVFVGEGYFARWNKNIKGGAIKEDLLELLNIIRPDRGDNLSVIGYEEDKVLTVINHHHDGTSRLKVKKLTSSGIKWYENNKGKLLKHELIGHLMTTQSYTKDIVLA